MANRSRNKTVRTTLRALIALGVLFAASRLGCTADKIGPYAAPPAESVVTRVIDGDTVEISGGELVRYIGIDTPETRRRVGEQWVDDAEPFGPQAGDANRRLVQGKSVRLEYDVEPRDRYGRLLAYVFVDEEMVNAQLLADGYARLLTIPPNVKHVEEFRRLAETARKERRGLWARPSRARKKSRRF